MNYSDFITRTKEICVGEPVIKGTRVTVRTVLASLVEGASAAEICREFPALSEQDIRAVIAFAAAAAEEDIPLPALPALT